MIPKEKRQSRREWKAIASLAPSRVSQLDGRANRNNTRQHWRFGRPSRTAMKFVIDIS